MTTNPTEVAVAVAAELDEKITEARALLKDLHAAAKEVQDLLDSVPDVVRNSLQDLVNSEGVRLKEATDKAIVEATAEVKREVDRVGHFVMGEVKRAMRIEMIESGESKGFDALVQKFRDPKRSPHR